MLFYGLETLGIHHSGPRGPMAIDWSILDTIKTYGSNISVPVVVVWKGKTASVIQVGWQSWDLRTITLRQ